MNSQHETKAGPTTDRFPVAVISTDPALRRQIIDLLPGVTEDAEVAVEIGVPYPEIGDADLDRLERVHPRVAFLDLSGDPETGLKFAQFLNESGLAETLVAVATDLSPDLLLASMRSGISEVLTVPLTPEAVGEALSRPGRKSSRGSAPASGANSRGKVVLVFSGKTGSGATTLSSNLAIEMHKITSGRVLLVDLDLELGETAVHLGMEPRFDLVQLLENFHRLDDNLLDAHVERHESGIDFLAAPDEPGEAEGVDPARVRELFRFLSRRYDYVVVDSPRAFNPVTQAALGAADEIYLVTTADIPSLRNIVRFFPLFRTVRNGREDGWIRVVLNRFDSRQEISIEEVEKTLGTKVFRTVRNDYRTVIDAINLGVPAVTDGKSGFARDVRDLAAAVTAGASASPPVRSGRLSGLLSSFGLGRDGS